MKNYLIIGNPILHSLSPKIHNYWFKENNIDGNYDKIAPSKDEIEKIIQKIKRKEIYGINVTVPFKRSIISHLETQSDIAIKTNSVNTIFNKNGKIHGDNTDVYGFEKSIINNNIELTGRSAFIFGAGGVVPSVITALLKLKIKEIFISNRTQENTKLIKNKFDFVKIIDWGKVESCDLFINCTSVGLKSGDSLKLNFNNLGEKKIFYDLIYNPSKTNFLLEAEKKVIKLSMEEICFYIKHKSF